MSMSFTAHERGWEDAGLADYSEFSDKINECDQRELGDCTAGKWWYAPDKPLHDGRLVIYHGTWGNYNAPGASSYTYAEVYDPDEAEEYGKHLKWWESRPEWAD